MSEDLLEPLTARETYLLIYGRPITGAARRRKPNATTKARLMKIQGGCCLYCGFPIGAKVMRRGQPVTLRLNWDHFIPHAYAARSPADNWVVACHVCNGIKRTLVFATIIEAQQYIRPRWAELGYEFSAIQPFSLDKAGPTEPAGPAEEVLRMAHRMTDRLARAKRIAPRANILATSKDRQVGVQALAFLVAQGHVIERRVDGRSLCHLVRGYLYRPSERFPSADAWAATGGA